ncbi:MAG TPA: hypothetical protein VNL14_01970 [Candidatus Acidoferrales bacterium]|nr:hypothetical protein [Candidatus Acidoferrales bacterium]
MNHESNGAVAHHVRRIGRLDIPGGGQVVVQGKTAYVGHIDPPNGTSIIDVSDLSRPRLLSMLEVPPETHSHKVRVAGDIMVVNNENYTRHQQIGGSRIPAERARLEKELGRPPSEAELADALGYTVGDLNSLIEAAARGYQGGGIRIFNVSEPSRPREIAFFKTGGNGVHRFDFDGRYAYLSTRMEGYNGYIVMIVDLTDPSRPEEVSRWWLPGQWIAGGEEPTWGYERYECHHPLRFGDRLYVSYCMAGIIILDISEIEKPRLIGQYNYHPPFFKTHTVVPAPYRYGGKDIVVAVDEQPPRPRRGQVPAFMWIFDATDIENIKPLSAYFVSEDDTPWKAGELGPSARFGAHQCNERMKDSLVHVTWFRGGLRIVDIADPVKPKETGYFIPTPGKGQKTVQSNDVFVDDQGIIYLIDRLNGLDILEYTGPAGQKGA